MKNLIKYLLRSHSFQWSVFSHFGGEGHGNLFKYATTQFLNHHFCFIFRWEFTFNISNSLLTIIFPATFSFQLRPILLFDVRVFNFFSCLFNSDLNWKGFSHSPQKYTCLKSCWIFKLTDNHSGLFLNGRQGIFFLIFSVKTWFFYHRAMQKVV